MSGTAYCMRCGARLSPDARFCAGCGHPIDDGSARDMSDASQRNELALSGDQSHQGSDAEHERLVVNWLRVGIVALHALNVGVDAAFYDGMAWTRGFVRVFASGMPANERLDWGVLDLQVASLLIWSAAMGAVGGRRRDAIWQAHTSGLILCVVVFGVLAHLRASRVTKADLLMDFGFTLIILVLPSLIISATMWGARWLGAHTNLLVPSGWLKVEDVRGWRLVGWVAWPFASLLVGYLVP